MSRPSARSSSIWPRDLTPLLSALCRIVMQVRLRMEAEEQRRATERQYEILSEGSSDLVVACDPTGAADLRVATRSSARSAGGPTT